MVVLLMNYDSLSLEEIEQILNNPIDKQQLINIGHNRFGISKSKLTNSSKSNALEHVLSALENERAYYIIKEQATIAGQNRRN